MIVSQWNYVGICSIHLYFKVLNFKEIYHLLWFLKLLEKPSKGRIRGKVPIQNNYIGGLLFIQEAVPIEWKRPCPWHEAAVTVVEDLDAIVTMSVETEWRESRSLVGIDVTVSHYETPQRSRRTKSFIYWMADSLIHCCDFFK